MFQFWMESIQQPWLLALLIILGTYILEDAAIVSAALLSADGAIDSELAFLALFVGVFTGDLGLYWLGKMLGRWQWLANWIKSERVKQAGEWLETKMVTTILLVRIVPGLRLPTYLACGYFNLSFSRFSLLVALASFFWTGFIFYGLYWFGSMFWSDLSGWKWLLLPIIIGLIMLGHKMAFSEKIITTDWDENGRSGHH